MAPKRTTIIYLYGPPAVGKTTIANMLSKIVGYPVLHPHLFTPIASVFMQGDMRTNRAFRKLTTSLRMDALRAAISAKISGVIVTGVYVYKTKQNRFIEMLRRLPAQAVFVRLTASERSLMRRVTARNRSNFDAHKINTREKLIERMAGENVVSPIRGVRSFTVDTDRLKPKAAASAIIKRYKLK